MAHPEVRRYVNRSVTGDGETWPLDWFAERWNEHRFGKVLVPGCGAGELERDLFAKGIPDHVEAFDISEEQVAEARRRATVAGLDEKIVYRVASFDELELETGGYGGCFFHQSLHHLPDPERALRRVARWLDSSGLLYLDEYVGPSQRQWNRRSFAMARSVYRLLPEESRLHGELEVPGLLARLEDPSEAIASDHVLPAVERYFEILERRDYRGFLLSPIWNQIREHDRWAGLLIEIEEAVGNLHPTWHTVIVARPKTSAVET